MSDRSIILKDFEVRAFIEGRKSQKRVALSPSLLDQIAEMWSKSTCLTGVGGSGMPQASIGDRLWARETFSIESFGGWMENAVGEWAYELRYRAGGALELSYSGPHDGDPYVKLYDTQVGDWRPSTQMPRWASRLTLIVEDVRIHRLQDISEEDAIAEGCMPDDSSLNPNYLGPARDIFEEMWERRYGPCAWELNPWVCAYSVKPILKNIDAISMDEAA